MGSAKTPKVPDPAKTYEQGLLTNIKYAPQAKAAEEKLRGQYDNQDVAQNLDRQGKFGGQALGMYKNYLGQVDPQGVNIRNQLGSAVSKDLALGHGLDPGLEREMTQSIRAGQAARGQTTGNAAVSAEALNTGSFAQQMYQQRLQNAGGFLAGDTSVRDLNAVAGLTTAATNPDRTFSYVNPLSGQQGQNAALDFYKSALAGGTIGGAANPWVTAATSVGSAAASEGAKQGVSALSNYLSTLGTAASAA